MEPHHGEEEPLLLAEFLSSLEEVGISTTPRDYERLHLVFATEGRWTRSKLRAVLAALLTKSPEERDLFASRFDAFFDFDPRRPADEERAGRIDVARALEELSSLRLLSPPPPLRLPPEPPRLRIRWRIPLAAGLLTAAVFVLPHLYLEWTAPKVDVRPIEREVDETPPPSPPLPVAQRQYESVPWIEDLEPLPPPARQLWSDLLTAALVLLGLGAGYGLYLWRSHRVREPAPLPFDIDDSERFDPGRIGGALAPWLADETLDVAAESLDYLETEALGRTLDAEATVAATSARAGLPVLVYRYRRELQRILVLEDLHSAPRAWNPVAGELVEGLALRGAPVVHGRFAGSPEVFSGGEDEVVRLRDLEGEGRYLRVLLVSDGEGLGTGGRELLQEVAAWAAVVWLDPREPRSWPEAGRRPVRCGIPLFPATDKGVSQAFRHFASLHSREARRSALRRLPPPLPAPASLRAQVEAIAGDALPWAQACSMVQPLPVGLADAVRCHFFPRLPPERLGRLFLLPGTRVSAAGLRFSAPVLVILRVGFQAMQDELLQEKVLRFLLERIDAAQPGKRDSLAALAWEALHERVRLELEPDEALERLARLAATPLGPAIRADLRDVVLPGQGTAEDKGGHSRIPLRRAPESFVGRQHLARLAPDSGIPIRRFRPLRWRERAVAGLLALSLLATGSLGLARSLAPVEKKPLLFVSGHQEGTIIRVGDLQGRWGEELEITRPFRNVIDLSGGFRVAAFWEGRHTVRDFPPLAGDARLVVKERNDPLRCTTAYPDFGLTLERCPPDFQASQDSPAFSRAGWREVVGAPPPKGRVLSVGLQLEGDPTRERELRPLRNALIATGSVDLLYRVDLTREAALPEAIREVRRQLDPWMDRAQLVWWWLPPAGSGAAGSEAVEQAMEDLRPAFATSLRLDRGADLAWASRIEELLTSKPFGRVTGAEIERLLDGDRRSRHSPGMDVLLVRLPLAPPPPEVVKPPAQLTVLDFQPSSSRLTGISMKKLDDVAIGIKQEPDAVLRAVGYTHPEEGARDAERLSSQRAEAVKNYLVSYHEIDPSRITTIGQGTALPPSIEGQAASPNGRYNRQRVEIYVTLSEPRTISVPSAGSLVQESARDTQPVRIYLHGLIALVPERNLITALLVDARLPPSADQVCFSRFRPRLSFDTSGEECVNAGCRVMGRRCDCALSRQEISFQSGLSNEFPAPLLSKRPKTALPLNESKAGDFSYIVNLAQTPLDLKVNPKLMTLTPPEVLAARMTFPFESVTACALVSDVEGNIQTLSFRPRGARERPRDTSQALAELAIVTTRAQDHEPLKLVIRDFDSPSVHVFELKPGEDGYEIELANDRVSLSQDEACADGVGRDFAFFYELAQDPPPWNDRLIPHVTNRQRQTRVVRFKAPECRGEMWPILVQPLCPMASFNP